MYHFKMKRGFSETILPTRIFEPTNKRFKSSIISNVCRPERVLSADFLKENEVNKKKFYSYYEIVKAIIYHYCYRIDNNLILNTSDLSIIDSRNIRDNLRRYEYEVTRSNGNLYYLRIMSPREIVEKILTNSKVYSNDYEFIYLISTNLINKYTNIERFRSYIRNYDRRWIKLYFTESYVCVVIS